MKKSKSFYIGWQDEIPKEHRSVLRKLLIPIFISLPVLAFILVYGQKGFNNHQFELGTISTLTGVYHSKPVPILEVTQIDLKEGLSRYVLLVGYGKFGAEGIMENIEKSNGKLNGKKITISGTLIYGDGRTLLELTEKDESLVEVHDDEITDQSVRKSFTSETLMGEILDPKCYFGVMKPGEGKIHKSCATRCISGGIPPVLRTVSPQNEKEYYILLGENGEKINKEVLDKIAELVEISGKVITINGWNYLYSSANAIKFEKNSVKEKQY
jgi:hypothetical protein